MAVIWVIHGGLSLINLNFLRVGNSDNSKKWNFVSGDISTNVSDFVVIVIADMTFSNCAWPQILPWWRRVKIFWQSWMLCPLQQNVTWTGVVLVPCGSKTSEKILMKLGIYN